MKFFPNSCVLKRRNIVRVFEGEGDGQGDGHGEGGDKGGDKNKGKVFTQDEVNALLAKEKRQFQEKSKQTLTQLEQLQQSAALTQEEKTNLEAQIEELRQRSMSAEEIAKQQVEKTKKEYDGKLTQTQQEAQRWEGSFKNMLVANSITDASIKHNAFSPQQIIAVLRPTTKVVEKIGADGKPTGEFEARVMFHGKNEKNEPVTLDLTVEEAVKQMRDNPTDYGNLFKDMTKGGVGTVIGEGKGGTLTSQQLANLTPAQYAELRKKQPHLFGAK